MKMKKPEMHWQILIALIAGTLFAVYLPDQTVWISWMGDLFLKLLKMVIIPLIVSSIITGIAGIGTPESLGRLGLKTVGFYFFTSFLAIILGLTLVNLIKPGVGADLSFAVTMETLPAADQSLGQLLIGAIPENIFKSLSEGNMLPVIFFSMVFGYFANLTSSAHQQVIHRFFNSVFEVMMKITMAVIRLTPLGVFAIIATVISRYSGDANSLTQIFSRMGLYMLTVLMALFIHAFFTLHLVIWIFNRINPLRHFKNMSIPLLTAFSTSSSSATLPLTMEAVEYKDGVSPRISSFTLPLGATINMNGTALYECIAAIFIAQAYGIDLTIGQQFIVVITALLAAVGSAGIPMAGLVMMAIVLKAVGLPLEGIGLVLAVDRILDMFRTAVNVYGDTCAAAVIAKSEGEKLNV
ncbi:MAG: dicarboxylate/amino acid:cation symporter [Lentimicrobium sp.]|jgi:Na+/H+-dicarboxylate symporter|uniref:dicarboxylate/amino acid:cation symporter n=2 Tax=Lentimicrobium sp. TaxID=2034841 RepID=UPI0029DC9648|nr:dicarboxylate/amino acid:cation symporter [Lentimicrobium sp.]MCO5257471.1 dicarboxylate/amino acid:cation symporter [Lentimicrobium sp.]MCO5263957.1 dicarboxylate/amino acid:cation symporter [Lentimicrobium sp.]HPR26494.1 dicarboxylate/amino acid:cation symporter [Lentimicrobium sp.]